VDVVVRLTNWYVRWSYPLHHRHVASPFTTTTTTTALYYYYYYYYYYYHCCCYYYYYYLHLFFSTGSQALAGFVGGIGGAKNSPATVYKVENDEGILKVEL